MRTAKITYEELQRLLNVIFPTEIRLARADSKKEGFTPWTYVLFACSRRVLSPIIKQYAAEEEDLRTPHAALDNDGCILYHENGSMKIKPDKIKIVREALDTLGQKKVEIDCFPTGVPYPDSLEERWIEEDVDLIKRVIIQASDEKEKQVPVKLPVKALKSKRHVK